MCFPQEIGFLGFFCNVNSANLTKFWGGNLISNHVIGKKNHVWDYIYLFKDLFTLSKLVFNPSNRQHLAWPNDELNQQPLCIALTK
jgi:hypothetical protein